MRVVVVFEADSVSSVIAEIANLPLEIVKVSEEEKSVQSPTYRGEKGDVASTTASAVRGVISNGD